MARSIEEILESLDSRLANIEDSLSTLVDQTKPPEVHQKPTVKAKAFYN